MALTPAWRTAIWHIVSMYPPNSNQSCAQKEALARKITADAQPLRDITPGMYLQVPVFWVARARSGVCTDVLLTFIRIRSIFE